MHYFAQSGLKAKLRKATPCQGRTPFLIVCGPRIIDRIVEPNCQLHSFGAASELTRRVQIQPGTLQCAAGCGNDGALRCMLRIIAHTTAADRPPLRWPCTTPTTSLRSATSWFA